MLTTLVGRSSHKAKPGAGYQKSRLRGPERPRGGVRDSEERNKASTVNVERIQSSCAGIILYIMAV